MKKDLKKTPQGALPPKATDKEKKDPDAPKRNKSAFIIYSNATRPHVKATNPEEKFGEIAQIMSKNYKALTPEERAYWDEKAAADKGRYQKENAEYMAKKVNATGGATASTPSLPPKASKIQAKSNVNKRKMTDASLAQANLFASFLKKKPKTTCLG